MTLSTSFRSLRHEHGVSLIEVLVTLLVLSVGLLGLAALQAYSLQSSQVSAQRTLAMNLAEKVSEDWRANRALCSGSGAVLPARIRDNWARFFDSSNDQAVVLLPGGTADAVCDGNQVVTVIVRWPSGRFDEEFEEGDTERLDEVVLVTRI